MDVIDTCRITHSANVHRLTSVGILRRHSAIRNASHTSATVMVSSIGQPTSWSELELAVGTAEANKSRLV